MRRRGMIGLAVTAALAAPAAARAQAARPDIAFRVLRQGTEVGSHRVRFREAGGLLEATSEVRIQVRLAGFTVFRYAHDTLEAWRGDRLVSLDSRLDRNGTRLASTAVAEAGGIRLRGPGGEAMLPPEAAPLTWWRAATLLSNGPVFDPRDGRAAQPRLERRREAAGTLVRVLAADTAEVLYDPGGAWIGFATTGEDGSAVRYERG